MRKDELAAISGPNEFAEFYNRLKQIKEFHRKHPNEVSKLSMYAVIHTTCKDFKLAVTLFPWCVSCRFPFQCLQSLRSWWRPETTPARRLRVGPDLWQSYLNHWCSVLCWWCFVVELKPARFGSNAVMKKSKDQHQIEQTARVSLQTWWSSRTRKDTAATWTSTTATWSTSTWRASRLLLLPTAQVCDVIAALCSPLIALCSSVLQKVEYIAYLSSFDQLFDIPKDRKNAEYKRFEPPAAPVFENRNQTSCNTSLTTMWWWLQVPGDAAGVPAGLHGPRQAPAGPERALQQSAHRLWEEMGHWQLPRLAGEGFFFFLRLPSVLSCVLFYPAHWTSFLCAERDE